MKHISIIVLFFVTLFPVSGKAQELPIHDPMVIHPEWYIKVLDWSVYSVWSGVAILHHVTIENTSDIAYKDIKVRALYYSYSITNYGKQISQETGILPVVVPPHSKNTYLEGGATLGASSMGMYGGYLEVLGAVPIIEQAKSK
ncbi:MAG TPA: hypothetical protein VI935_11230 [Thermodesulfobacteriota bacterium]|nr:hypothetical protein [Thermodesulfobacteriota bacterium]